VLLKGWAEPDLAVADPEIRIRFGEEDGFATFLAECSRVLFLVSLLTPGTPFCQDYGSGRPGALSPSLYQSMISAGKYPVFGGSENRAGYVTTIIFSDNSPRTESVIVVDKDVRDLWVLDTARATLDRLENRGKTPDSKKVQEISAPDPAVYRRMAYDALAQMKI